VTIPLYIFGASGHARELAAYFLAVDPTRPIWFVDCKPRGPESICVDEYRKRYEQGEGGESILGAGRCNIRRQMLTEMLPPYATFVHSSAVVFGAVGPGCVIAPHAVIAPFARLEAHVLINYGATVGHDTSVGQFSVIGPTAAIGGFCQLGEAVYVGAGALVREQLRIEADAVLGMGSVVTKDVEQHAVVLGVPAQVLDKSKSKGGWLRR
jgi:sugar O-acyltransferase (sialic acid O-acetyltransferase NeuD family)